MQMDRTASSLKKKANNRLVLVGYRTSRSKAECSERSVIRMSDSGLKWVRLAPNVTIPELSHIRFQYTLTHGDTMY